VSNTADVIELHRHPVAWTDPRCVENYLRGKRVAPCVAQAAVRFAAAVPPLGEILPRSWAAPLVASLPERPTEADLQTSVAGAACYFRYLGARSALGRGCAQLCDYDLLAAAHVVEDMLRGGFDREGMALELEQGAEEKVAAHDRALAESGNWGVRPPVSWLGGWTRCRGEWVVVWVPAGGGVAVAAETVSAADRPLALEVLLMKAFDKAVGQRNAPARLGVFNAAQHRAVSDAARRIGGGLLPVYRLHCTEPLRFWAQELVLG
jgi:hypothetical protein